MTGLGRFGVKLGLVRTHAILERAGNPQTGVRGALVSGTNGKGSTTAMLASILRAAGRRTALMTSPHLASYTERIELDEGPISEADFAAAVDTLRPRLEGITRDLGAPTEFEILTCLAVSYLAPRCERFVCEVGMGGRLDSTNVLDLGTAVITNVALDHQQYLGDTVEEIAVEKAGIIKAGNRVLTGASGPALAVIEAAATTAGASSLWRLGREIQFESRWRGWQGSELDVSGPGFEHRSLRVPLLGSFQASNAALAVATAEALGDATPEAVRRGIEAAHWPGRLELVRRGPDVLLDGGHNPAGLAAIAGDLARLRAGRPLTLVFGMMKDKDIPAALEQLRAMQPTKVFFTAAATARAERPEWLAKRWGDPSEALRPATAAVAAAIEATPADGMVLVCGSLYVIGEVRPGLQERP